MKFYLVSSTLVLFITAPGISATDKQRRLRGSHVTDYSNYGEAIANAEGRGWHEDEGRAYDDYGYNNYNPGREVARESGYDGPFPETGNFAAVGYHHHGHPYLQPHHHHRHSHDQSGSSSCCTVSNSASCPDSYQGSGNWNGENLCCLANGDFTIVGDVPSCPTNDFTNDGGAAAAYKKQLCAPVDNNPLGKGMGCLNVGDDESTCKACGCNYVHQARMCVEYDEESHDGGAAAAYKKQFHDGGAAAAYKKQLCASVDNNPQGKGMGCLNVGDDESTCKACGCNYVRQARMCVEY